MDKAKDGWKNGALRGSYGAIPSSKPIGRTTNMPLGGWDGIHVMMSR